MRKLFLAAVVAAFPAFAGDELVWKSDGISIRFTNEPCSTASLVMSLLQNGAAPPIRVATVSADSGQIPACWGALDEDKVLLVDVFGRGGFIARDQLKPEPGV